MTEPTGSVTGLWTTKGVATPDDAEKARPMLESATIEGRTRVRVGRRVWRYRTLVQAPAPRCPHPKGWRQIDDAGEPYCAACSAPLLPDR